jgi:hypothetical protein
MPGMIRWSRMCASLLVVFGVLTSAWATCAAGAMANPTEQMACCKAGHDHCPMKDSASDCCKKSGPQVELQGTVVKAASLSAPLPVVLTWAVPPAPTSAAHIQHRVSYDASPPDLLSAVPAYIAFSTLLI